MIKIEHTDDTVTAFISGDIDHHSAKAIREQIDGDVNAYLPRILKLDFKDVTFMDSSGIGLVMGRYKLMREVDGSVELQNISMQIKKVMRLAGLDRIVQLDKR